MTMTPPATTTAAAAPAATHAFHRLLGGVGADELSPVVPVPGTSGGPPSSGPP